MFTKSRPEGAPSLPTTDSSTTHSYILECEIITGLYGQNY